MFPQSAWFHDADQLARAKKVYNQHPQLLLTARDDRTYEWFQEWFPETDVVRAEDIVLSYDYPVPFLPSEPESVLVFARKDAEKDSTNGFDEFVNKIKKQGYKMVVSDTALPVLDYVSAAMAAKIVYRTIDQAHSRGVVITDRLHGAVFGLLAGRPVVVFENSYKKIQPALTVLKPHLHERLVFASDNLPDMETLQHMASLPDFHVPVSHLLKPNLETYRNQIRGFLAD